jgi:hypothetical protein
MLTIVMLYLPVTDELGSSFALASENIDAHRIILL